MFAYFPQNAAPRGAPAALREVQGRQHNSQDVWELVRMLATNQQIYREVLSLSQAQKADGVDWSKVFADTSLFK